MTQVFTKLFRLKSMFDAPPETRCEFSLEDPFLLEILWQWSVWGFLPDGGHRCVYAENVSASKWNALIAHLRRSGRTLELKIEDDVQNLEDFDFETFWSQIVGERFVMLSVELDGLHTATFFDPTLIEFRIWPYDVREANFAGLVDFMTEVSTVVGRPVGVGYDTYHSPGGPFIFEIDTHRRVAIVPVPLYVADIESLPST